MSNVVTTIKIVGQDQASEQIDKVKGALKKAAEAAESAGDRTGDIAERSGNLEQGVKGFRDILGQVGSGPLADIADKFGGIEATIKGFGPALGPWALGLAAVGAAAAYVYQQTEETRKASLQAKIAANDAAKDDISIQARMFGVSEEVLGKKKEQLSVQEAIAQNQRDVQKYLEKSNELQQALIDKDDRKVALLQQQVVEQRENLSLMTLRVARAKELAQVDEMRQAEALRTARVNTAELDRINGLMDARDRLAQRATWRETELVNLKWREREVQAQINQGVGDQVKAQEALNGIAAARKQLEADAQADAREGEALREQRIAREKSAHQAAMARAQEAAAARRAARAEVLQAEVDTASSPEEAAALRKRQVIVEAETAIADARRKYAKDAVTLDALLTGIAAKRVAQESAIAKAETDRLRAEQQAQTDAINAAGKRSRQAGIDRAEDPVAKYKLKMLDLEADRLLEIQQIKANTALQEKTKAVQLAALEDAIGARRYTMEREEAARVAADKEARIQGALEIAKVSIDGLEKFGVARQAIDGLRALEEAAEVYASYPNVPAMLSHGIAAAMYAKAALTSTPTASGGGSAVAAAANTTLGSADLSGRANGSGGSVNIVLAKGFMYGTPAKLGKEIGQAIGAAKGTGYGPNKKAA